MGAGTLWTVVVCFLFLRTQLVYAEDDEPLQRLKRQTKPIPAAFDARNKWPKCRSLIGFVHELRQGYCTSSWALATASAITDRICIRSKGDKKDPVSPQDLLECCKDCGSCLGGQPFKAWKYWAENGISTGGSFNSTRGCKPYEISNEGQPPPTMPCKTKCRKGYTGDYDMEKKDERGMNYYSFNKGDTAAMMRDIMTYGPIVAVVRLYLDFLDWGGKGIYRKNNNRFFGHQSVKIIGWGQENGVDYWLCTNSFGVNWGDDGLFKIRRGTDEVGIESYSVSAGRARVVRNPNLDTCPPTDVVFVVDSATAGTRTENTVINLVSYFEMPQKYQVGVVLCSKTSVRTTLQLGVKTDTPSLMEDMDDYVYGAGTAPVDIAGGIRAATSELLARSRPDSMQVIIILTKSEVIEEDLRTAARLAKQWGIWVLLSATGSNQRKFLSRIPSSGLANFLTNGDLDPNLPEDDAFYVLPLLMEEMCNNAQVCWGCRFDNGIYMQSMRGKCDMYWHCTRPNDRKPFKQRCPLGKFWDRDRLYCVWPTQTLCWADPCVNASVRFWPNEHYCGAYWQCNNSRTLQLKCCQEGESWDQASESCIANATCLQNQYCFQERACNRDFFLTFKDGKLSDLINFVYVDQYGVRMLREPAVKDGWVSYFSGKQSLTMRYYSNHEMGKNIDVYVRFRPGRVRRGYIQTIVTDGGCLPLEPSIFIGYEPEKTLAHAYIRTENNETEISLAIQGTTGYISLWYTYDGALFTLKSKTDAGVSYETTVAVTGKIVKTLNALKIGSSNYDFFGHTNFIGYIDEVSLARCSNPT